MASDSLKRLRNLLDELFQFDRADLDFGIYRIMNRKREEIGRFLDEDLLPEVRRALGAYHGTEQEAIRTQLAEQERNLHMLGMNSAAIAEVPAIKELRAKLAQIPDASGLENKIYSDLHTFFSRYYKDGDFLSVRRYKKDTYAIPYEGEEVKFYWANADQYYVKSSETLQDYRFRLGDGRHVHLRLATAETERDNNKAVTGEERRFILCTDESVEEIAGELNVCFEYRSSGEKQARINEATIKRLMDLPRIEGWRAALCAPAPTMSNPGRTLLEKHLTEYTAKNSFDYFIHKDLGGFLRRELDFYLKNEVLHIDDLDTEDEREATQYLARLRAIKTVGFKIIDFLAQLEDFQKKLWLKRKFVVRADYCVTLDMVPAELYREIAANDEQREEWVRVFAIDEIKADTTRAASYSEPLSEQFLRENQHLMLDTRFFDGCFKEQLLSTFDSLDEALRGLLVDSENLQALRLVAPRFARKAKAIYIDPPYNTGSDGFLYKDNYRHSSWIAMMRDRLIAGREILSPEGVLFISIDDTELGSLLELTNTIFNPVGLVTWFKKRKGSFLSKEFVSLTEYALVYRKQEAPIALYGGMADSSESQPLVKKGNAPKNLIFPANLVVTKLNEGEYKPGVYGSGGSKVELLAPAIVAGGYFVTELHLRGPFVWTQTNLEVELRRGSSIVLNTPTFQPRAFKAEAGTKGFGSFIDGREMSATNEDAFELLRNLFGSEGIFSNPKPINYIRALLGAATFTDDDAIVLDFFAGTGTTGHAVINLNREDGGSRKYILVEMGEYFDTVLKPRIQKAIYSKDWRDGKPVSREGSSHMFKYMTLESYEDTLNNLEVQRPESVQRVLDEAPEVREDYMLRYMLDLETRDSGSLLNLDRFEDPFNYELRISDGGETRATKVDLVETFNWLLGLRVHKLRVINGYRTVEGTNPDDERVLVIWRSLKDDRHTNAGLERFFAEQGYGRRSSEEALAKIYVNGDNTLTNLRETGSRWDVLLLEEEFRRLMWASAGEGVL